VTDRRTTLGLGLVIAGVLGCGGTAGPPSASTVPAISLGETRLDALEVGDADAFHGPLGADGNAASIFGALPIAATAGLPGELSAFLGRWEGYGYGPPIKRDWKYVLAVTEITPQRGTAYVWAATNLQFPAAVTRVGFRVRGSGTDTTIEWEQTIDGAYAVVRIGHASGTDALEGSIESGDPAGRGGPLLLRRDTTDHVVYRDYERHLADHGIAWRDHATEFLRAFGAGSLVHLPVGYADDPDRTWPLILFLHGSGDRGRNGLVIAQNSPMRFVTDGGRLGAIVVAPLLDAALPTFPTGYLDAVLDDAIARYRVDPRRVTLTGLSMGGESTYRFARHRPDAFAAIAVLCGWDPAGFEASLGWGYEAIPDPPERLRDIPVRAIHGRNDRNIPLEAAQATIDALTAAGVDVEFTVLEHHDHDVWTDTYTDPRFFDWLLAQTRAGPKAASA